MEASLERLGKPFFKTHFETMDDAVGVSQRQRGSAFSTRTRFWSEHKRWTTWSAASALAEQAIHVYERLARLATNTADKVTVTNQSTKFRNLCCAVGSNVQSVLGTSSTTQGIIPLCIEAELYVAIPDSDRLPPVAASAQRQKKLGVNQNRRGSRTERRSSRHADALA